MRREIVSAAPNLAGPNQKLGSETLFNVGQETFVFKTKGRNVIKANAHLIGWVKSHYLILSPPMFDGSELTMDAAEEINIKFISRGKLVDFHSQVIGSYTMTGSDGRAIKHLIIRYPANLESLDIRSAERHDAFLPGTVKIGQQNERRTVILDISQKGAKILLRVVDNNELPSKIQISFPLPNGNVVPYIQCFVRRTAMLGEGKMEVGVEFSFAESSEGVAAQKYISDYLTLGDL